MPSPRPPPAELQQKAVHSPRKTRSYLTSCQISSGHACLTEPSKD